MCFRTLNLCVFEPLDGDLPTLDVGCQVQLEVVPLTTSRGNKYKLKRISLIEFDDCFRCQAPVFKMQHDQVSVNRNTHTHTHTHAKKILMYHATLL